jgi:hypothetical protein
MGEPTMWDRVTRWIAYRMPRSVVYWCTLRAAEHCAMLDLDEGDDIDFVDLSVEDVLDAWG